MRCFVCSQDLVIGHWDGKKCVDFLPISKRKISEIIKEMIGPTFIVTLSADDLICNACVLLVEHYQEFKEKVKNIQKLFCRQVYRTYEIKEKFEKLSIDEEAMKTFTKSKLNDFCCIHCGFRTRYIDTIPPHFLTHNRFDDNRQLNPLVEGAKIVNSGFLKFTKVEESVNNDAEVITIDRGLNSTINLSENYDDFSRTSNNSNNNFHTEEIFNKKHDNKSKDYILESIEYMKLEDETDDVETKERVSEETVHCQYCNEYFSNNEAAALHMKLSHIGCSDCNKMFETRKKLGQHLYSAHHGKIYICDYCSKKYRSKTGIKIHLKTHLEICPYKCEICDQGFYSKYPYEEHMNAVHSKTANYICAKCGQTFYRLHSYQLHLLYHDNPQPFKCKLCPKSYATRSTVALHTRREHTREYKFKCDYCSERFFTKTNLKVHLIEHTNVYPWHCTQCNKGFTRKYHLTKHLINIHNDTELMNRKKNRIFKISVRKSV